MFKLIKATIKIVQYSAQAIEFVFQDAVDTKKYDPAIIAAVVANTADTVTSTIDVASVVGTAYAVSDASGKVIMATMAKAGAIIGGGVIIGTGIVGGAGGWGAANLMNKTFYTDCQNQKACDAAKVGTYIGAAVGTAASVGTLMVLGAGTAELASIGAVIGGGMAAGATAVVAAPIVVAAAVGAAIYWGYLWVV
jgi:hypothetical protein